MTEVTQFFQFKNYQIAYKKLGSGPKMVFLHNGGGHMDIWQHQLNHFAKKYEVLAFDFLRFGSSDKPNIPTPLNIHYQTLHAFLQKMQIDHFILVGVCMGASVAIDYANRHPDKVEKLVLFNICPGVRFVQNPMARQFFKLLLQPPFKKPFGRLLAYFIPKLVNQNQLPRALFGSTNPKTDTLFYQKLDRLYKSREQFAGRMAMLLDIKTFTVERILRQSRKLPPRILFWGGKNKIIPLTEGLHLKEVIKPQKFYLYPEGGHLLMNEFPEQINQEIDSFLSCS